MLKVLIVDDETAIRKLIRASLRDLDLDLMEASTGLEAINITREWAPSLVILDIVLTNTGIDGVEAARLIKRNRQTHTTKILMISGHIDLRGPEITQLGVEAVLAKPFDPNRMRRLVCSLLGIQKKKAV